ncbi:MAG TPA: AAA family ATPase [Kribbella sp.]|nr:AAA family ATPase [Kribbella sp.]
MNGGQARSPHGLVIGKFYPPHLGHHHLVSRAAEQTERLTVLVLASAVESIPLGDRVAWLTEVHRERRGEVNVSVIGGRCDVPVDLGSETVWTAHVAVMQSVVAAHTDVPVDAVFSSEVYGDELASRLGAAHVLVDPARTTVPVSGTAVRGDLASGWGLLHPVVRAGLATRVVVVGAESTGTTTVSRALADHYRARGGIWSETRWVPEHGRDYTVEKLQSTQLAARANCDPLPRLEDLVWDAADFEQIAATQNRLEDEAAAAGSPLVVCDTDAFATSVWEYRYAGADSHGASTAPVPGGWSPRLYLVTDHTGVPFVQDGWRDGEHIRTQMTAWFLERLTRAGHSWVLLTGSLSERLELAVCVTDEALSRGARLADPLGARRTQLPATIGVRKP